MKTTEQYVALVAAMVFVVLQHREKPWLMRVSIAGASGGMGYAVAPEVAGAVAWLGEISAMVLVTALIYAALDMAAGLIADRDAIKAVLLRRGRKGGE